MNLDKIDNQAT